MNREDRASEIARFLNKDFNEVKSRLELGFGPNHVAVNDDFRASGEKNDDELLDWYRNTDAYIYELTAYHLEEGFNYSGMCYGITSHLKALGKNRVLVLGDGVGDLSLALWREGLTPIYNDLADSKTSNFAQFRFEGRGADIQTQLTNSWNLKLRANSVDAIVALDFFEHLTEVEQWARECYKALRKGGQFMAQNAFAIGDDDHGGSISMHLVRNNRFEHDWVPLMNDIGFIDQGNSWWTK